MPHVAALGTAGILRQAEPNTLLAASRDPPWAHPGEGRVLGNVWLSLRASAVPKGLFRLPERQAWAPLGFMPPRDGGSTQSDVARRPPVPLGTLAPKPD